MNIGRWLLVLVTACVLTGCSREIPPPVEQAWTTMGTFASLTLPASESNRLELCVSETTKCFKEVDEMLSVYIPESEISELNSTTGIVSVGDETFMLLEDVAFYADLTEGAFDPTVGSLIQLWGFSGGEPPKTMPPEDAIAQALERSGYKNLLIEFTSKGRREVSFTRPGMSIDLGGIAKGHAVDNAYHLLSRHESLSALINLGGNIRCLGKASRKRPWRIGVRNPFDGTQLLGSLSLEPGQAIATSGNYERFIMLDGKRYSHIIDPVTGYPVQGMAGVTVLSGDAKDADVMSTALFVKGMDGAPALLAKRPETHALLVPDRTPIEIWVTHGLKKKFKPLPEYKKAVRVLPEL